MRYALRSIFGQPGRVPCRSNERMNGRDAGGGSSGAGAVSRTNSMPKDTPPADNSDGHDGSTDQRTTSNEVGLASITPQSLSVSGTHGIAQWEIHPEAFDQCVVEVDSSDTGVDIVMDGIAGDDRAGAMVHLSEIQAKELAEILETLITTPEEKHD